MERYIIFSAMSVLIIPHFYCFQASDFKLLNERLRKIAGLTIKLRSQSFRIHARNKSNKLSNCHFAITSQDETGYIVSLGPTDCPSGWQIIGPTLFGASSSTLRPSNRALRLGRLGGQALRLEQTWGPSAAARVGQGAER